jgi:hypothetical protein
VFGDVVQLSGVSGKGRFGLSLGVLPDAGFSLQFALKRELRAFKLYQRWANEGEGLGGGAPAGSGSFFSEDMGDSQIRLRVGHAL